jgi:hypothetical protein
VAVASRDGFPFGADIIREDVGSVTRVSRQVVVRSELGDDNRLVPAADSVVQQAKSRNPKRNGPKGEKGNE